MASSPDIGNLEPAGIPAGSNPAKSVLERWERFRSEEEGMARLARRLVRDPSDAEDLLQDALVRILRHPTGPRDDECFRAWCYGLLRNAAADFRRSAARRCRADHVGLDKLNDQADGTTPNPETDLDARLAVTQSETLDKHDRELLMRRYMLEQTAAEIAQELASTPPAIRMKLKRILTKLRGMFVLIPLLCEGSENGERDTSVASRSWLLIDREAIEHSAAA